MIKAGYQRFWTPCDLFTCSTCRPAKTVQLLWSRQVIKGFEPPVTFLPVLHADQLRLSSVAMIKAGGYQSINKSRRSVFWKDMDARCRIIQEQMPGLCYWFDPAHRESTVSSGCEAFCRGFEGAVSAHHLIVIYQAETKLSTNTHYFCIHVYLEKKKKSCYFSCLPRFLCCVALHVY